MNYVFQGEAFPKLITVVWTFDLSAPNIWPQEAQVIARLLLPEKGLPPPLVKYAVSLHLGHSV